MYNVYDVYTIVKWLSYYIILSKVYGNDTYNQGDVFEVKKKPSLFLIIFVDKFM